jgi:protein involved in polysaccharide export with SLBB domain
MRQRLSAGPLAAAICLALLVLSSPAPAQGARPGDADEFRTGDRIILRVEGEQQLTDTFTVREGPAVELPSIGRVPLAGVSHGEIEPYLTRMLGKYLKSPVVRARALMRIGILGELARPGYYNVASDALVSDLLGAAGGPTKDSKIDKSRIDRAGSTLVKSDSLRKVFAQGLTVSQIGLRSGDDILIARGSDPEHVWRVIAIVVTIPAAIYGAKLLFK